MYLYCYARSAKSRITGQKLLAAAEGEWIEDIESFVTGSGPELSARRADAAIVLILPQEICIKLLLERLYPADIRYPILNVTPDGRYAGILRTAGYNTYQILGKVTEALGSTPLSGEDDRKDIAPDIMHFVSDYNMTADDDELLSEIASYIKDGGTVDVYSDLPLEMREPVLDVLSYKTFLFQSNQRNELNQAYKAANEEDRYSVFITFSLLEECPKNGKVLLLIPRIVTAGVEVASRCDPDYAVSVFKDTLASHGIDRRAVITVASSALIKDNAAVNALARDLDCYVTFFDSRLIKAVKVPLNIGFSNERMGADFCTAAACLASDNGRIWMRRSGDKASVLVTAAVKRAPLLLT